MKTKKIVDPLVGVSFKDGVVTLSLFELDDKNVSDSVYTNVELGNLDAESLYNKLGELLGVNSNPTPDPKTPDREVKVPVDLPMGVGMGFFSDNDATALIKATLLDRLGTLWDRFEKSK